MNFDRRAFLKFLGAAGISTQVNSKILAAQPQSFTFSPLGISTKDELALANGLLATVIIRSGDPISSKGEEFGTHNDFIAYSDDGYLWVNHETPDWLLLHGVSNPREKTKKQIIEERKAVGGSYIRIERSPAGKWQLSNKTLKNFRVSGETPIVFSEDADILKASYADGMVCNCSGGKTPWGTFLTCEENYHDFYGEVSFEADGKRNLQNSKTAYGWAQFFQNPPEHYGWVVEVDPRTQRGQKLISLGRFAHEGALVVQSKYERCIVYMGDDKSGQCIYKFIGTPKNSLTEGKLYVADTLTGKWKSIAFEDNPQFKEKFGTRIDTLIRTREAAHSVGGTPLPRPEGIARDPISGDFFVSLTGDATSPYGSILKIRENNNDPLSLEFKSETYINGSQKSGFAAPDNIIFDKNGNLWMCVDFGGTEFGNNSLYVIPRKGKQAGQPLRVAACPLGAEFTGPCLTPDGKTLFISVQHPGEHSTGRGKLQSHWPDGGTEMPRSAVVALEGPLLEMFSL